MNEIADAENKNPQLVNYWRLWLLDTVLVSGSVLAFLATHYGTHEFFGLACLMAVLPTIPIMVLVGGAGSTIFALTKIWIEKRSLKRLAAVALLVGPALAVMLLLGLLGSGKSPGHRLAYICLGNVPTSASQVQVAGYSTFLSEEWLAVFKVLPRDFQAMANESKLAPVDMFEFKRMLEPGAVKNTSLFQSLPPLDNAYCFKRVFKESDEHQRGSVYAVFDPITSTAVVVREYRD